MPKQDTSVLGVLIKAFEESNGETLDLIIDHKELHGVTPEIMHWWGANINNSERYMMWCPEDHVAFEWEIPPGNGVRIGSIQHAEEKIGEFPASLLRIRGEDPSTFSISRLYSHYRLSSILSPDNRPIAWIHHEFEETHNGMNMRSTFRLPAQIPRRFIDALRRHCEIEMEHLSEFLPNLYRQNVGLDNEKDDSPA